MATYDVGGGELQGGGGNLRVTSRASLQDKVEEKIEKNRKHLVIICDVLNDIKPKRGTKLQTQTSFLPRSGKH